MKKIRIVTHVNEDLVSSSFQTQEFREDEWVPVLTRILPGDYAVNRVSLKASVETLRFYLREGEAVEMFVSSEYVHNCFNGWIESWLNNGWKTAKNRVPSNLETIKDLYGLMCAYGDKLKVSFSEEISDEKIEKDPLDSVRYCEFTVLLDKYDWRENIEKIKEIFSDMTERYISSEALGSAVQISILCEDGHEDNLKDLVRGIPGLIDFSSRGLE